MQSYQNKSQTSGITHYEIGEDYISLKFNGKSAVYTYTYELNGKEHIEEMKARAEAGQGLSTYINQHKEIKNHYIKKRF